MHPKKFVERAHVDKCAKSKKKASYSSHGNKWLIKMLTTRSRMLHNVWENLLSL